MEDMCVKGRLSVTSNGNGKSSDVEIEGSKKDILLNLMVLIMQVSELFEVSPESLLNALPFLIL